MALGIDGTATPIVLGGSGTTSQNLSLTTTQAGEIVVGATINGATITSITATGLTFSLIGTSGSPTYEYWRATSSSSFSGTITINFSLPIAFTTACAWGVSGTDPTTPMDTNGSNPNTGGTAPRTISTTAANTIVFGGFRQASVADPTPGSGYTEIATQSGFTLWEYQIFSSAQTSLSVNTGNDGDVNGAVAFAFQAAAASSVFMPAAGGTALPNEQVTM
jgi:hypothetical protein